MQLRKYIALSLMLLGCAEQQVPRPDNLIPKGRMIDILYDIALLDAIDGTYPNAMERNGITVMAFVYEKYGIDSLQLAESDFYYASRPDEYEEIYTTLEGRITSQRDSINEVIRGVNEKGRENLQKQQAEEKPE
jgi:hypothetical protein